MKKPYKKKPYTKKPGAKKEDQGKKIFDGFDKKIKELETKIESPETEKAIIGWLQFQSQFHNYSFRNTVWMMIQAEARDFNLTKVAPFHKWSAMKGEENKKVSINKGSKGFTVLFPFEYIIYERDKNGKFLTDKKGEKVPERDENGKIKKSLTYGAGYVFDVQQTNAKEIGAYKELNYRGKSIPIDPDLIKELATRIEDKYKIDVEFENDTTRSAGGWYTPTSNRITVNLMQCKNNAHVLGTLFHELGHARLHKDSDISRELAEGQAEAFAYAASSAFGVERESQLYIKNWVEDKHSLSEVMGNISKQVRTTFKDLNLNELAQEHAKEYYPEQVLEQEAGISR